MKKFILASLLVVFVFIAGIPLLVNWYTGAPDSSNTPDIKLYRHDRDSIEKMDIEEYVAGVVAAEMPARFPDEALKAQAVAARTYVLKKMHTGGVINELHPEADICDDPTHAQAWWSREKMKEEWGVVNYYRYYFKIRKAADSTRDTVITYDDRLIDPVYHSTCGGKTENSGDVWEVSVSYLKSVECPYGENPEEVKAVSYRLSQLEKALQLDLSAVPVSGGESPVKVADRTGTGRVKTVDIAGVEIPATVLRERLGLRSTKFSTRMEGDRVAFITQGYGHGVGMCQYGAKGMAEQGYDYRDILNHYYTGVNLEKY